MKKQLFSAFVFLTSIFLVNFSFGQQGSYDPHQAFDPFFNNQPGTAYRSADGQPGPKYWVNRADYQIHARLDTLRKTIQAKEVITYTNNSPNSLQFLWLLLDQNRYTRNSRSAAASGQIYNPQRFIGGFEIRSVEIGHNGKFSEVPYLINDTRMQIRLSHALVARGGKMDIRINYTYKIPPKGNGRNGWMNTQNGTIFEMAQWFPRMAVYDDLAGWNILPFLGAGEFFLDYGDFDIYMDVPADQIVAAPGRLSNPDEVLTKTIVRRLNKASKSNQTIHIRLKNDLKQQSKAKSRQTWHFEMQNSRDFAWASSTAFLWDAAKINLPNNKTALAQAFYPVESSGKKAWDRATEFLKHSVEIFSAQWFPYPYPTAITVGGPVGGMEYPAIVFCHWRAKGPSLWMVTNHEIGHVWFPMIVGSDERRNAWMDEGMNTFIDIYAADTFNRGEFAPKSDHEYNPKGGSAARGIVPLMLDKNAPAMMTYADNIPRKYSHPLGYYKSALGLVLLRESILGHTRFDYAFRTYIRQWAYKHPSPTDFFRTMNNAAGEDLNWFWKGWYVKKWTLDQVVTQVNYVDDNPAKGSIITLENKNQLVMPVTLKITQTNGKSETVKLPVEIWRTSGIYQLRYSSTEKIESVVVDPDKMLPDVDDKNNHWPQHE
jgi:hypothetical protein